MPETLTAPSANSAPPQIQSRNNVKINPELGAKFRAAADPDNTTGRNKKPEVVNKEVPANEPIKATPKPAVDTKSPVVEKKAEVADLKGDPSEGFSKQIEKVADKETNLANLRKKAEEAEVRATQLEARAKELEGKVPLDYDQIKADRETLIKEIERVNVEKSPRFQEKYDKPIQATLTTIRKTLANTDSNPDEFSQIVQMPESKERTKKLSEMLEGLDRVSEGKVTTAIAEFDRLREGRQSEIANPSQTFQQIQQENELRSKQQKESSAKLMQDTIKNARDKIAWFKPIEGNEAWNQKIDNIEKRSWSFWTENHPPEQLAELTLAGAMAPVYAEALAHSYKEVERLQEELAQYKQATPANGAGNSTSTGTKGDKPIGALAAFRTATGRK